MELPPAHTRTKLITDNPVAAAQVFDRVMRAFFAIIAGIPLNDFTGKRANVDRLLFANRGNYVGVFGKLHAAYGVIEAQSSSSLHTHFIYGGIWIIRLLSSGCTMMNFASRLQSLSTT